MTLKKIFIALLTLQSFVMTSQLKRKVLFLGNSYTYVNNLPQLIKDIALSKGDTLVFDQNVIGGYTFQNHWNDATTYSKLQSNTWDVVVIQGQSQEPSFHPSQVMSFSYPYAKNLADSVRKMNPCIEVMYYMTWGRKNGDAGNCPSYPPVCTFNGMNARLRQSYLMFADSMNASCAPVGVAWKKYRDAFPSVELYQPDESHPSAEGSYLAACVFYSSIFKKAVSGATYCANVNVADAQNMQNLAGTTVMDSMNVWNLNSHIPTADFTYSLVNGNTYQFNNSSVNANSYNWSFGSTQTSPQNTFIGNPPYSVTLTAINNCTSTSIFKTINLTAIGQQTQCKSKIIYFNNELRLDACLDLKTAELFIYDMNGKHVRHYTGEELNTGINISGLHNGIYLADLVEKDRHTAYKLIKE